MSGDPYGGNDPSVDDCIRAGMYWFSRRDLEAARAWWERAVQLEPTNPKATECIHLLEMFEETSEPTPPAPPPASPAAAVGTELDWEGGVGSFPLPATLPQEEAPPPPDEAPGERGVWPPPLDPAEEEDPVAITTDPLEFASMSEPALSTEGSNPDRSPWDGPSRTSVVTLSSHDEFDAVAEPTPLPELDKERFFGRIHDDQALVEYMVATGDLLIRNAPPLDVSESLDLDSDDLREPRSPAEIVFDEPVEMAPAREEAAVERTPETLLAEARDRFQLHDFQGVIDSVGQIPPLEMSDEARNLLATSRANLLKMYESKIGPTDRVPKLTVASEEVIWLGLNHRAGFILSQIDGSVTYEDLIALSGMDRLDTVRILAELVQQEVITS